MCTNYWEFIRIYAHVRAYVLLFERLALITCRWRGIEWAFIDSSRPSCQSRTWLRPRHTRFDRSSWWSCLAYARTREDIVELPRTLYESSTGAWPDIIWTTPRTINIQNTRVCRARYKTRAPPGPGWHLAGATTADYTRDRSKRGRSPTTCPRNNRRRSILDNTLVVRSRLEHTRAFVYSGHSTHLTRLTHCRKWKKFAAASRGADSLRSSRCFSSYRVP